MKYVVLKMSPVDVERSLLTGADLPTIMRKSWRITNKKAGDATKALVLLGGTIITILDIVNKTIDVDSNQLSFELVVNNEHPEWIGQRIRYTTSNPASVMTEEKLLRLLAEGV